LGQMFPSTVPDSSAVTENKTQSGKWDLDLNSAATVWTQCLMRDHVSKLGCKGGAIGGGETFRRWGLEGGLQVTGAVPLKGTVEPQCFSCPLLSLTKGNWSWTGVSKSVSQNKPLLFISWLPQIFCYGNGKLTHTPALKKYNHGQLWQTIQKHTFFTAKLKITVSILQVKISSNAYAVSGI
jgi:hypothetical protein